MAPNGVGWREYSLDMKQHGRLDVNCDVLNVSGIACCVCRYSYVNFRFFVSVFLGWDFKVYARSRLRLVQGLSARDGALQRHTSPARQRAERQLRAAKVLPVEGLAAQVYSVQSRLPPGPLRSVDFLPVVVSCQGSSELFR